MWNIATLKIKLIIAGILLAIMGAGGLFVWHLSSANNNLHTKVTQLDTAVKSGEDTIQEGTRRSSVIDEINKEGDAKRASLQIHYQTKINKIDKQVQEGKDKPVGPLLQEFFNDK
jgi:cell division protein YceG involved in septum cleavage